MLGRSQTLSIVLEELKKKKKKESFWVARQLCDKSWRESWEVKKKKKKARVDLNKGATVSGALSKKKKKKMF